MSQEPELLKKADEAWIELERFHYEVVAPHSYREKKGRKLEHINPWKDMPERIKAEEKEQELYQEWLHLFQRYIALTGERPHLEILYKGQETPNGIRWVKGESSPPAPR